MSSEKFWGKILFVWENKNYSLIFFCFSSQNLSKNLLKLHSKCPEELFSGEKCCLKHHKNVYFFWDLKRIFFGPSANIFDKIVKTAFYVSKQTFCRKKLIHQFQILRDLFKDFGQETRITLSSFQNCTQRVESEFDRTSPGLFFDFSAGFPNWTLALRRKSSRKITFQEKNFNFSVFGRWPNWIKMSRGTFCLELQFWIFFHQFMILSHTFWDLVEFFWFLFSKMPSTSPQDLLKECFFSGKTTHLLSFSNFEQKRQLFGSDFSTELWELYFTCQNEHLDRKFFSKKKFIILFSGLSLENVRILSVSFRQLSQNCIYVSKGTFWGKQVISEKDVFFRDFNWRILDLQWSFSAGLSKRLSKCPEVSFERFIFGKIFQVNFTFLENSAVGFWELNLACPAYYFEKNCLLFWKPETLSFNFGFGAKTNLPYFQKTSESSA